MTTLLVQVVPHLHLADGASHVQPPAAGRHCRAHRPVRGALTITTCAHHPAPMDVRLDPGQAGQALDALENESVKFFSSPGRLCHAHKSRIQP